jgi:hypothetical protein
MEVFMQPIKRPRLSLLLSFICSILALGGIGGVSLFLPRIMEHYITRFVPGVMDQYALILAILYVALAIALAVVCLLLYLLHIVRTDRVFTLISSRLVLAIACLVITEGLVFGLLGMLCFPLAYAIFLLIQAIILDFDSSILIPNSTTPLIYPYFFVNLDTLGVPGVLMWIGILAAAFVAVGFLFFGLDRLGKKKKL